MVPYHAEQAGAINTAGGRTTGGLKCNKLPALYMQLKFMGERVKAVRMCKGLSETAVTSLVLYASKSLVHTYNLVCAGPGTE